ncbi:MAG: penicillin-binding protein 2, partial [bacterium]|nr:penicillin-binding protein 2 [bacterium]
LKNLHAAQSNKNEANLHFSFIKSSKLCVNLENLIETEYISGVNVIYLVNNKTNGCKITIAPNELPSQQNIFKRLQELLGFSSADFAPYISSAEKKAEGLNRFKPTLLISDIPFESYARIETAISLGLLPGVAIFDSVKRRYIHGEFASHTLGFLNEISAKELTQKSGYKMGQLIGRKGLEKFYEKELRGVNGVERYVVDAKGRRFNETWEKNLLGDDRFESPKPGHGMILSLDYEMQKAAEKAFSGQAGSVVALEVGTGFVLALASFPGFNPNDLIAQDNQKTLIALNKNPLRPWVNKAIQDNYAPGSTFKTITAIAGFEHNLITTKTRHDCTGIFYLGRTSWRCYKRDGHGTIDVVEALKSSCDSFFYTLGHALESDNLANTARLLGFGKKTGIDLDPEVAGLIPDKNYYEKRLGYHAPGFVINSSVGQGDVTVTPIQLVVAYEAILNGGTIYKPQLVRKIVDINQNTVREIEPEAVSHLKESKDTLALISKGLSYVMNPGGTASGLIWRSDLPELSKWLRQSGVVIGGKTGTAQVVKLSKLIRHLDPAKVEYLRRDHAWFIGFAPAEKPEVVIVAMTEHGGFGGTASAPVVAELIKTWYEKVRGKGRYAHFGQTITEQQ